MDCSLKDALPKPKTLSVNGIVIPREDVAREVQNHAADKPILAWQAAARALVVRELLRQESSRLGISAEPQSDDEGRTETMDEAAMRALIEREVVVPEPDDAVCRRFYNLNQHRFCIGDLHEAAHILITAAGDDDAARSAARTKADAILASVRADPTLFAAYAGEQSDCEGSAREGGSLGQLTRGQTVPEFEAGLASMKVGEIAIIETRYGVHVVRLDQHVAGRQLPFEMVRERIAEYLRERVQRRALAQYVSILAGRATIAGVSLGAADTPLVQ
jgi:peptidyl-prolyl cis-trans isomerase C